ncbi:MLO-like protein 12 [Lycium barbarum]|uniref:MLO-like protein 12 n=1 Tax=Lycium barbarum TaxID=112863 RepID=UPI00293EA28D|nr:MLO-like protein 12 [Lycium barbarum]
MASSNSSSAITLETTPTWAVAVVCFILITISILIEHALHVLAKYFNKKRRKSLIQAIDNVKSELMLLGFISLLLTVLQKPIAKICIPKGAADTFLPCQSLTIDDEQEEPKCEQQGKKSLMSEAGVQQLQLLIFALAFFHILSCFLTFSLGTLKMRRWKLWEAETRTLDYQFSYGKLLHNSCRAHFAEGTEFDFQKYIRRALDKDFKVVVGISPWIWTFSVLFIFFNAYVFHSTYWLPFIPLVMLLLVGTKLQGIITKMCLDSNYKSSVVRGNLMARPDDQFFWFGKPKLLLHLMHFWPIILFQNSFQLAFFTWTTYKYGLNSCFHRKTVDIATRLVMGVLVYFLCGYVTLPLYALVTQMGTKITNSVLTDGMIRGLRRWQAKAKKKLAIRNNYLTQHSLDVSPSLFGSPDNSLSLDISPSFRTSLDGSALTETVNDEDIVAERQLQQHRKLGSFNGFQSSKFSEQH